MDFYFLRTQKEAYMPRYIPSTARNKMNHADKFPKNQYQKHIRSSDWKKVQKFNKSNKRKRKTSFPKCTVEGISYISSNDSWSSMDTTFPMRNLYGVQNKPMRIKNSTEPNTKDPQIFVRREMESLERKNRDHFSTNLRGHEILEASAFPSYLSIHAPEEDNYDYTRKLNHKDMNKILAVHCSRNSTNLDEIRSFEYASSPSSSRSGTTSSIELPHRYRRDPNNLNSEEMPSWVQALLIQKSSLNRRFQRMKASIQKWSLRARGVKISESYEPKSSVVFHTEESQHALSRTPSPDRGRDETAHRQTSNNLVVCMLGLFLMVVAVFPVIVLIFIYTDRSDFIKIEVRMVFNGTMPSTFDVSAMTLSICSEIDNAFSEVLSFYSCDVIRFLILPQVSEILTVFRIDNIPGRITMKTILNEHFTNLQNIRNFVYIEKSVFIHSYEFLPERLLGTQSYSRVST